MSVPVAQLKIINYFVKVDFINKKYRLIISDLKNEVFLFYFEIYKNSSCATGTCASSLPIVGLPAVSLYVPASLRN